jgi:protein-disulfide isomerase
MSRLKVQIGPEDHVQGDEDAPITLIEYGDYQCPHCARAYPIVKAAKEALGHDLRFVFRNFPLSTLHRAAENAAEAAEIAGSQGKFWEMHDMLFENASALDEQSLIGYAAELGIDPNSFATNLANHSYSERVRKDFMSGMTSGVNGTPTFFVNGERYDDPWDHGALLRSLKELL